MTAGWRCFMGDLLSLRQLEAPVKVIVFRNDSLAFVELEMKAAGVVDFATDPDDDSPVYGADRPNV